MNKDQVLYSAGDQLDKQADELTDLSKILERYGTFVAIGTFFTAVFSVIALAISFSTGSIFPNLIQNVSYSTRELISIIAIFSIFSSVLVLIAMIRRDSLIKRGQIIQEILVELSERRSLDYEHSPNVNVMVAIRTFTHLQYLPMSNGNSLILFYLSITISSLIISLFILVTISF